MKNKPSVAFLFEERLEKLKKTIDEASNKYSKKYIKIDVRIFNEFATRTK